MLAGADVDRARVARIDIHSAQVDGADERIHQRRPLRRRGVEVGGLPEASARGGDVDRVGIRRVDADGANAAGILRLVKAAVELGPRTRRTEVRRHDGRCDAGERRYRPVRLQRRCDGRRLLLFQHGSAKDVCLIFRGAGAEHEQLLQLARLGIVHLLAGLALDVVDQRDPERHRGKLLLSRLDGGFRLSHPRLSAGLLPLVVSLDRARRDGRDRCERAHGSHDDSGIATHALPPPLSAAGRRAGNVLSGKSGGEVNLGGWNFLLERIGSNV